MHIVLHVSVFRNVGKHLTPCTVACQAGLQTEWTAPFLPPSPPSVGAEGTGKERGKARGEKVPHSSHTCQLGQNAQLG